MREAPELKGCLLLVSLGHASPIENHFYVGTKGAPVARFVFGGFSIQKCQPSKEGFIWFYQWRLGDWVSVDPGSKQNLALFVLGMSPLKCDTCALPQDDVEIL